MARTGIRRDPAVPAVVGDEYSCDYDADVDDVDADVDVGSGLKLPV